MMKRRRFLALLPAVALLQACYDSRDETLFADRGVTRVLLAADDQVQGLAEAEIARPLREALGKRAPDADIAFVCIDNGTGDVLAYVPTLRDGAEFDNCRAETRDIGSTVKPLVYGVALQMGAVSTADTFPDVPIVFKRLDGPGTYAPKNYGGSYSGKELTVVDAIAVSSNSVAVQVYRRVDQQKLRESMSAFGLPLTYNVNLMPIGRWAVSPLALASAFTVFPNGGYAIRPRFVTAKVYADGRRDDEPVVKTAKLFGEDVCAVVSEGMKECLTRGTGAGSAADLGGWARGKTGSSRDALSVLQSKRVTAVLWVGNQRSNKDLKMTGGHIAMPYLARFFRALRRERPDLVPPWE
jgi:membrane peptidoglycan carboxypeptidase